MGLVNMLIVRKNRQKKLEEEIRKIAGLLDTHLVVKARGERRGFVLLAVEEFGWKDSWGPVGSFLLRIRSLEHVEDTAGGANGKPRQDCNRMKVIPEKGTTFQEVRRAFLKMRGPAWLRLDIRRTGEDIIIRDLVGLELFESLSRLSEILDGTRAVPQTGTATIKQKDRGEMEAVQQVGEISRHYFEVGEGCGCPA